MEKKQISANGAPRLAQFYSDEIEGKPRRRRLTHFRLANFRAEVSEPQSQLSPVI